MNQFKILHSQHRHLTRVLITALLFHHLCEVKIEIKILRFHFLTTELRKA